MHLPTSFCMGMLSLPSDTTSWQGLQLFLAHASAANVCHKSVVSHLWSFHAQRKVGWLSALICSNLRPALADGIDNVTYPT